MSKDNNEFPSFLESQEETRSLGKALQDARLNLALSVDEVGAKLNLGASIITDIEDNLKTVLETQKYPTIYLRGYLSNYAKLVSFKNLESYIEFQSLNSAHKHKQTLKSSSLIMPRAKKRSKKWPILLLLLLAVGSFVYYYQAELSKATGLNINSFDALTDLTSTSELKEDIAKKLLLQSSQNESPSNAPLNKHNNSANDDANLPSEVIAVAQIESQNDVIQKDQINELNIQQPVAPETVSDIVNSEADEITTVDVLNETTTDLVPLDETENNIIETDFVDEAEIVTSVDLGPENLSLQFNGECWTEVYDATGERIAFGLYDTGRVLTLTGMAPFKLKLGDPSAVEIQYQDKIIEGEFTPGRSAQFTVPLS